MVVFEAIPGDKIFQMKNDFSNILTGNSRIKKKRKSLTPGQRLFIWEHPKMYGRKCNICGETIKLQSDLELDHTKAHSKGGTTLSLAHKHCNRVKGSGSLGKIQKALGIKSPKQTKPRQIKTTIRKPKQKEFNPFQISKKELRDMGL